MKTDDGELTVRARLLMCSVDLPARAVVLNMKQFNGEYGCCYCEDAGVARSSSHLHRNWPLVTTSTPRTHQSILSNARTALQTQKPVSVLILNKPVSLIKLFYRQQVSKAPVNSVLTSRSI